VQSFFGVDIICPSYVVYCSMLKNKIAHTIGVNGLLEFSRDEKSGLSLWVDVGDNVWTWDQIVESAKLVTKEDLLEGMKNADGELCDSAVLEVLPQDDCMWSMF